MFVLVEYINEKPYYYKGYYHLGTPSITDNINYAAMFITRDIAVEVRNRLSELKEFTVE